MHDRWINLRADDCVDMLGRTIAPYYVFEQPEWITVVPVTPDGHIILVNEYRHGARVVGTGLVGGTVEETDSTPIDAALRELEEETGYIATELIQLGFSWANWANQTNRVHHFLATGCIPTGQQAPDDNELIEVSLQPFDTVASQLHQAYHQLAYQLAKARLAN